MNNAEQETGCATAERYNALMSMISRMEDRLRTSELVCFSLNLFVLMFSILFVSGLVQKINYYLTYMDYALSFLVLIIGMSINVYWVTFAMRLQLKLKLRYFQARSFERKMDCIGEYIFSDENIFFDPGIRFLNSYDNKERVEYPTTGLMRMDGFIGNIKPRQLTWMLPCLFIVIYWTIFILLITTI
ncbi:MAG: hypothetical protein HZC49_01180 [Nitrospirae bacterium]|nr:hypothetical protein [Nitrospirota bacterium]